MGAMDPQGLIARLESGPALLRGALAGITEDELRWSPAEGAWSALEVACHLLDEEREDFRVRLRLLLEEPDAEWPPIDPPRWAKERGYADRDLKPTLKEFEKERAASVAWLRGLDFDPDRRKVHPKFGAMTAGSLLGAWAAHDVLHLRQLAKLRYLYVKRLADPHDIGYAGEL